MHGEAIDALVVAVNGLWSEGSCALGLKFGCGLVLGLHGLKFGLHATAE